MKLKGILGYFNAQYASRHVNLPSKIKVHQTKSRLEGPAKQVAWVRMIHYINTAGLEQVLQAQPNGVAAALTVEVAFGIRQHKIRAYPEVAVVPVTPQGQQAQVIG